MITYRPSSEKLIDEAWRSETLRIYMDARERDVGQVTLGWYCYDQTIITVIDSGQTSHAKCNGGRGLSPDGVDEVAI